MNQIDITNTTETDSGWSFEVSVDGNYRYVDLSHDYYQKITKEKVLPEVLIGWSFEFLLQRESLGNILPEFNLPLINHYFPEYESHIAQRLNET